MTSSYALKMSAFTPVSPQRVSRMSNKQVQHPGHHFGNPFEPSEIRNQHSDNQQRQ